ncbi:metal-dependent hydrolase [Halalkalicoccus jeotgali]|uniref:Membrane-bound metal-dependent hydrolase n=1 Tax=Halalkalicoccus jeotgali (strain DSM 18796 / CECT 7217 / JCM 14584 / KCTC 4019 / B3) TaxID=795797 RepID=D8JAL0_HALJB|nr:metal-dependent hydrolase [Halalkalicoccus jeotgali]ADJ14732.1 hypothetical protein HacjB3_06725 [Halalkalicoccus jeotgali B3]ELY39314.1 hypothetical protein C497_05132 [Halalkalicoccus jeotgali B3]
MPPVTVHIALGGLIGAVLLADHFDTRAIFVVMGAAAVPDLDVFVGFVIPGAHRAALHSVLFPIMLSVLLIWDVYWRERSFVSGRWGTYGVQVCWVAIVSMTLAHIVLDSFGSGINAFWPVYDRYYMITGDLVFWHDGGFTVDVLNVVELGTTADTHYGTGFDTVRANGRRFPVALTGEQFVLLVASGAAITRRIVEDLRTTTTARTAEYLSED